MPLFNKKAKRTIVFLQFTASGYTVKEKREVDADAEALRMGDKAFFINKESGLWDGGPIVFDSEHAEPLLLEKVKDKKNPRDLALFMQSTALDRLVKGHMQKLLLIVIGGLVIAVFLTGIWGMWSLQGANKQLLDLSLKWANSTRAVR
jgi:hypothetical protein